MRWLLFVSRLAFICNLLFLLCLVIQRTHDFIHNQDINNYIITLGWFVSPVLNAAVNSTWLILAVKGRKPIVPTWLLLFNLFIFIAQIFIHFIFPS